MVLVDGNVAGGSVNFAGRSLYESLHSVPLRGLAHVQRALYIRIDEAVGRFVGIRNRNECGEMKYNVDIAGQFLAEVSVPHIAGNDFDLLQTADFLEPAPVVERVIKAQGPDLGSGSDKLLHQVRANKAVRSGHEHTR